MVYALAIGSAFFYGLAAVLQHREAAAAPQREALKLGLLAHLIQRPLWVAGIAADVAGFGLQAAALGGGPLTLVQPVLTTGLMFALIISALWDHRSLAGKEVAAAAALMTGLALLLTVGAPSAGRSSVPFHSWIVVGGLVGVGVLALVAASRRSGPRLRPALLAVAAAVTFAASDALIKSAVDVYQAHGIWEVLDGWYLYGLIVVGLIGTLLIQSAFQAGPLTSSLPALTAVEPIASSIVGIILFAEVFSTTPVAIAAEVVAMALALFGIWVLGRSPVVIGRVPGEDVAVGAASHAGPPDPSEQTARLSESSRPRNRHETLP